MKVDFRLRRCEAILRRVFGASSRHRPGVGREACGVRRRRCGTTRVIDPDRRNLPTAGPGAERCPGSAGVGPRHPSFRSRRACAWRGSGTADRAWSRPSDSAAPSDSGGRPAAATASSRADGEDQLAGTGLSLMIEASTTFRSPHGPCPPPNSQLERSLPDFAAALATNPARKTCIASDAQRDFSPGLHAAILLACVRHEQSHIATL